MGLTNPFAKKKQPSDEDLLRQQASLQRDQAAYDSATQPTGVDEQIWLDRQEKLAELRRWQQDLSPMLNQFFLDLAGVTEDENNTYSHIKGYTPHCSLTGARRIVNFLKPIDKNVMLGNWQTMDIQRACLDKMYSFVNDLKKNYKLYGIKKNYADLTILRVMVTDYVQATYKRGWNNGERNLDGKIHKSIETNALAEVQSKKGIFSS